MLFQYPDLHLRVFQLARFRLQLLFQLGVDLGEKGL
jgi:hypothetical protein